MHVRATRNTGATKEDIKEALLHVAVYAGVPAANHAIQDRQEELSRKWKQIPSLKNEQDGLLAQRRSGAARESQMSDQGSYYQRDRSLASGRLHAAIQDLGAALAAIRAAVARQYDLRDDRPALRAQPDRPARQRPDPQLRQDRRCHRPAHDRLWPGAGRERPSRAGRSGRVLAGQCRRSLPAQEGDLSCRHRPEFRRLRTRDHR